MSEDIIIIPDGIFYNFANFANKLMTLMCAIDLELRINKKIKILYTLSYNDFLFNNKKDNFMDELPDFKFKNISYEYLKYKNNKKINITLKPYFYYKNYLKKLENYYEK